MTTKLEHSKQADLKELLTDVKIQLEAMTQLLIEKNIISSQALNTKIKTIQVEYSEKSGTTSKILKDEVPLDSKSHTVQTEPVIYSILLPQKMNLTEDKIVCNDPISFSKLCGSCVFQGTSELKSGEVVDICSLPNSLVTKVKRGESMKLKGINANCWISKIAENILAALEKKLISPGEIPELVDKTIKRVQIAMEQNIIPEGICSIIECAILVEKESEAGECLQADKSSDITFLPRNMVLIDNQIVCEDPVSFAQLCGECSFQRTIELRSGKVADICDLPNFIIMAKNRVEAKKLKGINQKCWMRNIADSIFVAVDKKLIISKQIPAQMVKAAKRVQLAIDQNISFGHICNIIECWLLVEDQTQGHKGKSQDIVWSD